MHNFLRLLKLSGLPMLMEALSPKEATAIFKYHGATDSDLADEPSLKQARRRLMMANHPDKAGATGLEAAKEINAAYDVLKAKSIGGAFWNDAADDRTEGRRPDERSVPEWQTDKRSNFNNIRRNDYHDLNFIKKHMWELCRKSCKVRYTVWNYDGNFFRGCFTVFGAKGLFSQMVKAMQTWDDGFNSRAVFVTRNDSRDLLLIWSDGQERIPPIVFEHESFNLNPGNDQHFIRSLPEMLDKIRNNK